MSLSGEQVLLCRVAAALASGERERIATALAHAAERADGTAVEEVLVQSYLFLGYPAALNGLAHWREISSREAGEASPTDWDLWESRGREVCAAVYGGQYDRLRANVRAIHPDMERWMLVEGYGKVLGRPGLDLITRELAIVAQLAVLGTSRQLYSHARGAISVGASPSQVEAVLSLAAEFSAEGRDAEARAVWDELCRRGSLPSPSE